MLPSDWAEYLAKAESQIKKRPEDAPARARAIKPMKSPRQRRAESGTKNFARSVYEGDKEHNQAQVVDDSKTKFTHNVGGNCEGPSSHGKNTNSRR